MTQQLYVTFIKEYQHPVECIDGEYVRIEKTPLGFAAEYNPNSSKCVKKNDAQNIWAKYTLNKAGEYVVCNNYRHVWPDGVVYCYSERVREGFMKPGTAFPNTFVPDIKQICDTFLLDENIKPKILNNDPLIGFKIVDTVTRCSTSNKLWRISDPRGFELEISTANMEEILMTGVVDRGVIVGECIWDFGKNGIGKATLKRI